MEKLIDYIQDYWKYMLIVVFVVIIGGLVLYRPSAALGDSDLDQVIDNQPSTSEEDLEGSEQGLEGGENSNQEVWIMVDVKGFVKYPGVYEVLDQSRVKDVVELAGGFSPEANHLTVNLAEKVRDQMVIYVGGDDDPSLIQGPSEVSAEANSLVVNINLAGKEELMQLNSIGSVKADSIIQYREENGLFEKIEDLKKVSGIGDKTFENLKDNLTI